MKTPLIPSESNDAPRPTIFIFGSQVLSPTKTCIEKLLRPLSNGGTPQWINETVAGLPEYWKALIQSIPEVEGSITGEILLADLDTWLRSGIPQGEHVARLPNILLTPLVIISQLTQYCKYMKNQDSRSGSPATDPHASLVTQKGGESVGFCIGLLSSFAVASSRNQQELERYGAVAVRIAMLIGALADAQESRARGLGQGRSVAFATAWWNPKQREDMIRVVESMQPEAYVSVLWDNDRATITVAKRKARALAEQLRSVGVTAVELGLKARVHNPHPIMIRYTDALIKLCNETKGLSFPTAQKLVLPTYTNGGDGNTIAADGGSLHETAIRAVLVQQCSWFSTFSTIASKSSGENAGSIVTFGPEQCVPPSLAQSLGSRLISYSALDDQPELSRDISRLSTPFSEPEPELRPESPKPAQQPKPTLEPNHVDLDDIAVVGMSLKVAGADDVIEFGSMLRSGESQHEEITPEKIQRDTLFRNTGQSQPKLYGNFIRDPDAFDHKFFKRSPRESATMDPQQRQFLQTAYQAVEQSGYFTETSDGDNTSKRDKRHVGVYVGSCAGDYEHHVACHPSNAFSATGVMRSFVPGKVSHYFGWTGPAMVFDTACSSSAVAIHTACKALRSGECNAALAGGIALMSNINPFQDLSAASFLSTTGQCKPFDEAADGYCRAEGVACVFLKKFSDAVADGNQILACIASTAVHQNQNCTPLFVPNSPSLSNLFKQVMGDAKVSPSDISLVEAHGTGTPVGDPAEYDSIRLALGGPVREKPLPIGSIKGHIGHTEGASGVIALIKIITMLRGGFLPKQAGFTTMSRHIDVKPGDMMEVVTSLRPWVGEQRIALLNNYGASGSNSSMIVKESPFNVTGLANASARGVEDPTGATRRFPFWLAGLDARSIAAYSAKLAELLKSSDPEKTTLADLCFSANTQSNRGLQKGLFFNCRSRSELQQKLEEVAESKAGDAITTKPERPVILCFGGQTSTLVCLDHKVYDSVAVLRHHLDRCNDSIVSQGHESIYPGIFAQDPVNDPVKLQLMLFALQYASAKCWLDCGLEGKVVSVVGHSFGEITAMCIAGVLSLQDTIELVAGRAQLVKDTAVWGSDPGAMLAVEADEALVNELLTEINAAISLSNASVAPASVACYNGPRSFTLAGSTKAIDQVAEALKTDARFSSVKSKRLSVTNAFHCALVEPLVGKLESVGKDLTFNDPVIPIERATESKFTESYNAQFVPNHMRRPVYFDHAVQRLAQEHAQAIFLEAGSSSTITIMANRALVASGQVSAEGHYFQAMALTGNRGFDGLSDATLSLWKQGLRVAFWAHHALQVREYSSLLLPPYQFDKTRHWLEMKSSLEVVEKAAAKLVASQSSNPQPDPNVQAGNHRSRSLLTLIESDEKTSKRGDKIRHFRFFVDTESEEYVKYLSGHLIAQTAPICPATLEIDMAMQALMSVHPERADKDLRPILLGMANHNPLCIDAGRSVYLDFTQQDEVGRMWKWTLESVGSSESKRNDQVLHADACLHLRTPDEEAYIQEFSRYERIVSHSSCKAFLNADIGALVDFEVLQGRNIYKAFSEVVDYGEIYRGVKSVIGGAKECVGIVHKQHEGYSWLDVPMSDSFSQVAGIWVNLLTDCPSESMYIATGCELTMRSPRSVNKTDGKASGPNSWHVLAKCTLDSEGVYMADIFVFDAVTGDLAEVMLGIRYARVAKASMGKMLVRLTADDKVVKTKTVTVTATKPEHSTKLRDEPSAHLQHPVKKQAKTKSSEKGTSARPDITDDVRKLVANISGAELHEVTGESTLIDLGIDSLMGMELIREAEAIFKCTIELTALLKANCLNELVVCILDALYGESAASGTTDAHEDNDSEDGDSEDENSASIPGAWSESMSSDGDGLLTAPTSGFVTGRSTPNNALGLKQSSGPALSRADILSCFGDVKMLSDKLLTEAGLDNMDRAVIASTNQLCAALVVEALDELGSPLRTATPGQVISRVPFEPQHHRLMEFVYKFLERDARLIDIDHQSGQMMRTAMKAPAKPSTVVLEELMKTYPSWAPTNRLTHYAGKHLAQVLGGNTDGIKVIFGSAEGRELVKAMYCEHTFNLVNYGQMRDTIGNLVEKIRGQLKPGETLKILEMGGGTGGTTRVIVPHLASLNIPLEYTFTDLSASMVANMRRQLGSKYPFIRFAVHDIEKAPADELTGQHIILASNAVHATHSLVESASNMRQSLRSDGFLMMLEMTEALPFIDMIFGLLEGWWLFNDGRTHAIAQTERWERDLHAAGFGHVDWTDGSLPEHSVQKVIIALASGPQGDRLPKPMEKQLAPRPELDPTLEAARAAEAEHFVSKHINGWSLLPHSQSVASDDTSAAVVIVTGATGSLGSHLVQAFASRLDVKTVICLNRRGSSVPVDQRQAEAFSSRGIELPTLESAKLWVLETDATKPQLGLPESAYSWLSQNGTHIVHNAWPMSGTRPIASFQSQFQVMRGLLDLANDMAARPKRAACIGFEFVSSIGVVGQSGETRVMERKVPITSTLSNGYGEAKWVCERMLEETLQKHPKHFRAMTARPGQIAGSSISGYWNPVEHFAFLVKSSQSLNAWPDLDGTLQWVPVDHVANTMVDLLQIGVSSPPVAYPVYHIDNPVGQSWKAMSLVLADALGIPALRIVPFQEWVRMVRRSPLDANAENPAAKLVDFLSENFERMSCGGLVLDTTRTKEHSRTMAREGPVSPELARRFVAKWSKKGFLQSRS